MKKYYEIENNEIIADVYVGRGAEILPMYKSMYRAWNDGRTWRLMPVFTDLPKVDPMRIYGISIDNLNTFHIMGRDTVLAGIVDGWLEGVK